MLTLPRGVHAASSSNGDSRLTPRRERCYGRSDRQPAHRRGPRATRARRRPRRRVQSASRRRPVERHGERASPPPATTTTRRVSPPSPAPGSVGRRGAPAHRSRPPSPRAFPAPLRPAREATILANALGGRRAPTRGPAERCTRPRAAWALLPCGGESGSPAERAARALEGADELGRDPAPVEVALLGLHPLLVHPGGVDAA